VVSSATFVLLPSPLLGPAAWEPVAAELRAAGRACAVVPGTGTSQDEVLAAFAAGLPDGPLVLVPHSNAGLYVPALAERRDVAAVVFVDAALPSRGGGPSPVAPLGLVDYLRTLADADGMLPPWTRWWDEGSLAALFPDDGTRQRVQAEERSLPLSYFTDAVPTPPWDHLRCAYLAFGATYADEVARARAADWPVEVVDGGHLEMLHCPERVARQVVTLAEGGA
jgi:hypothetical protein